MTALPQHPHNIRFPDESDAYRRARDALLDAEKDVRDRTEEVARQRRDLPLGGMVPTDYEFQEWDTRTGSRRAVALSELFDDSKDTLFVYSFMFIAGRDGDPIGSPCPNCTSIIDAVAGQARHLTQRINLAVSAKAPIEHFRAHAHSRGWADIRLLSSGESTFNRDYGAEDSRVGNGPSPPCLSVATDAFITGGARSCFGPRTATARSRVTSTSCGPTGTSSTARPRGARRTTRHVWSISKQTRTCARGHGSVKTRFHSRAGIRAGGLM
jgi:predicted dithiol-disulfide oxidoreductase (DUF899 family)